MKETSFEARNAMHLAISSQVPLLPMGTSALARSSMSALMPAVDHKLVCTIPIKEASVLDLRFLAVNQSHTRID